MATRPSAQTPNRPGNYGGVGAAGNSLDVGHAAVARMAREDTRWFVAAVVILSLVLFLALPLSLLVLVETAKMKSDVQYEMRQMKRLRQELKEQHANRPPAGGASNPDGL